MLENLPCLIVGYFFGCISSGYIVGKFFHMDIRNSGSGSAGATNVLRILGKVPAIITFLGDFIKAAVPIFVFRFAICSSDGWYLPCLYMGLGVVLGHNYPFYLKFRGGKGIVVTAAVVFSTAHPIVVPIGLAIFVAVVAISKYVSLGSLFVAWYIPANTVLFYRGDAMFAHMMAVSLVFTALAYFQHRQNIVRLVRGTENKLGGKKRNDLEEENE